MFDRIAQQYDLMNWLMTLGQDRSWRRRVIGEAQLPRNGRLLDVATGTGRIAEEALRQNPGSWVLGVDSSLGMMRVGKNRLTEQNVVWCAGDALCLPCADSSFDAVVSGYLIRNVGDIQQAFREQVRVVKPGGRIVCLETAPPPNNILRPLILFHLRVIIPLVGRWITGDTSAYTYLPESTRRFAPPEEIARIMQAEGLEGVHCQRLMFGTMMILTATRPY